MRKAVTVLTMIGVVFAGCGSTREFSNWLYLQEVKAREAEWEDQEKQRRARQHEENIKFANASKLTIENKLKDVFAPFMNQLTANPETTFDKEVMFEKLAAYSKADRLGKKALGVSVKPSSEPEGKFLEFQTGGLVVKIVPDAYIWYGEGRNLGQDEARGLMKYPVVNVDIRIQLPVPHSDVVLVLNYDVERTKYPYSYLRRIEVFYQRRFIFDDGRRSDDLWHSPYLIQNRNVLDSLGIHLLRAFDKIRGKELEGRLQKYEITLSEIQKLEEKIKDLKK